jgi:tight adherence protein C
MLNQLIYLAIGVAVIVVFGAIVLVIIGMRSPETVDERILQDRLDDFAKRGEKVDLEKIEMSLPFQDRIVFPLARKLGEIAIRFTPQNALQNVSRKLELAGSPARLDPTMFLALQFIVAAFFGGAILLALTFGQSSWPFGQKLLAVIAGCAIGYFFPQLWLSSKISRRQKEVRKALPDALDLLTICVEAGLGFDMALAKVSEKWESELSLAFARVIQEIQLGKLRREALRDMADRIGLPELTSFVAAVIQSELLGVSMAKVLRIQSDQMRIKRRQRAEEEAHKAPVKMLIPMALLIFPSLMIVLMTPAVLKLMNSAMAGMIG